MPRAGRPKAEGTMFHLRIAPELAEKLRAYAEEHKGLGVTQNDVVRYALEKFFSDGPAK